MQSEHDSDTVRAVLLASMNACPKVLSTARRFADDRQQTDARASTCLRNDFDGLITWLRYKTRAERKKVRATNAI